MNKIPTLFDRADDGRLLDAYSRHLTTLPSDEWVATEKLDGANVRVTVRSGELVRLEARRNPTKNQKHDGIIEPWYRDASPEGEKTPDFWLWDAARNTNYSGIPDGEWPAEAVGPKIQGNPLQLESHTLFFFSLLPWRDSIASSVNLPTVFGRVPVDIDELHEWMLERHSGVNPRVGIEGIVWWYFDDPVAKIKLKDYG
ncbi:MAG: RNA ligase family protein [bacterium]